MATRPEATLTLDDAQPFEGPKLAPARFQRGREVELSNFATWADVSALLQPSFVEASRIPAGSPLQAEIKKIADQFKDPKRARAQAVLTLVQDQVCAISTWGLTAAGCARRRPI